MGTTGVGAGSILLQVELRVELLCASFTADSRTKTERMWVTHRATSPLHKLEHVKFIRPAVPSLLLHHSPGTCVLWWKTLLHKYTILSSDEAF